jgi:exonuclease SbcD
MLGSWHKPGPVLLLQTSDWHLGRTLLGRSLIPDQAHVLEQLVQIVLDRRPEIVLIVGDLFERSSPQEEAVALLDSVISRLVLDCKVKVVVIPGQGDKLGRMALGSRLVDKRGLQVITSIDQALSPISLEDADGPLHLITLPYLPPASVARHFRGRQVETWSQAASLVIDHLTRRLRKKAVRGVVAAYLRVEGGRTCGVERPMGNGHEQPVALSIFEGISYGAFGYLHEEQRLGDQGHLCYSGSILSYSFEEDPGKGVLLAEVDAEGNATIEKIDLVPKRQLHQLAGTLEELLLPPRRTIGPEDLVKLQLTAETGPIKPEDFEVLQRLYPNLVAIDRPVMKAQLERTEWQDAATMFAAFYQQATGNALAIEERVLLLKALDEGQP